MSKWDEVPKWDDIREEIWRVGEGILSIKLPKIEALSTLAGLYLNCNNVLPCQAYQPRFYIPQRNIFTSDVPTYDVPPSEIHGNQEEVQAYLATLRTQVQDR